MFGSLNLIESKSVYIQPHNAPTLAVSLTGSTVNQSNFHIPFPNDVGTVVVGAFNNTGGGDYSVRPSDGTGGANGTVSKTWFKTYNTWVTGQAGLSYIAAGT